MRRGLAAAALLLAACTTGPAPASSPPPLVLVSGASPFTCEPGGAEVDAEVEPSLALDPHDQRHLVAAWQQDRDPRGGARGIVAAVSRDGGATWRARPVPGLSTCSGGPFARVSDPVVGIGAGGRAYLVALGVGGPDHRNAVLMSASVDGGTGWAAPVPVHEVTEPPNFPDKPTLLADPARPGAALVAWSEYDLNDRAQPVGDRILATHTEDGGASWSSPSILYGLVGTEATFATLARVRDAVVATFVTGTPDLPADPVRHPTDALVLAVRSTDGGAHWSGPARVTRFRYTAVTAPDGSTGIRANGLMHGLGAGADGQLYESYVEEGGDTGSALSVAHSGDGGLTWDAPVAAATGPQVFIPCVAVAGDGTVAVMAYDLAPYQAGSGRLDTEVGVWTSRDRGRTWRQARLAGPFDLRKAASSNLGAFVGDYQGAAGYGRGFGFLFVLGGDTARRGSTDVFFRRFDR